MCRLCSRLNLKDVHLYHNCKVKYEPLQWALRRCIDFNGSILTQPQIKAKLNTAEVFLYSIYWTTATMFRGRPPPTTIKLSHKPTATASQTIRLPSHFTAPNHMVYKHWKHNACQNEAMATLWRTLLAHSCPMMMRFCCPVWLFYMSHCGSLQWKIEIMHISQ